MLCTYLFLVFLRIFNLLFLNLIFIFFVISMLTFFNLIFIILIIDALVFFGLFFVHKHLQISNKLYTAAIAKKSNAAVRNAGGARDQGPARGGFPAPRKIISFN